MMTLIKNLKRLKLPKIAQHHPVAFWVSIAFHVLLFIGLISSNIQNTEVFKSLKTNKQSTPIIQAVVVDEQEVKQEKQRLLSIQKAQEKRLKMLKRSEKKVENERYKEQQRLKTLKAKIKKAEKLAKAKKKQLDAKIKEALKKKKLTDKKTKEALKKKKLADKKTKEALKNKVLADKKLKEIEEKTAKRLEEIQKQQALAKKLQSVENKKREAEQESIINELRVNYINQIASRVRSKWRYGGAKDDWSCVVHLLQDEKGRVYKVELKSCNVDNKGKEKSFRNAIIRAVKKSSPLPAAPDKRIFERKLIFNFRVN